MSKQPTAKHRVRPLVVASDTAIAEVVMAHGLIAHLYPPKRGACTCCKKRVDRLVRDSRRCVACAAACGQYVHREAAA